MKVEVEIPEGKNCRNCPFLQEVLDSYGYEESHNWCAYLKKDLNKEVSYGSRPRIKKLPDCPSLIDKKRGNPVGFVDEH